MGEVIVEGQFYPPALNEAFIQGRSYFQVVYQQKIGYERKARINLLFAPKKVK